jgi:hypothetical protein
LFLLKLLLRRGERDDPVRQASPQPLCLLGPLLPGSAKLALPRGSRGLVGAGP